MTRRLVVTLPPGLDAGAAKSFAQAARARGASLLEVRTDLYPPEAGLPDLEALGSCLELLVAERGAPIPDAWRKVASVVDREVAEPYGGGLGARPLVSHHATKPLRPDEAIALWRKLQPPPDALVKHVEPLGNPPSVTRLMETQRRLGRLFGAERVTVLATGPSALPFRCVLSRSNELEYVAAGPEWSAAPGQRLLADAVRELRRGVPDRPRLGIIGSKIAGSRSPRIHRQPFDRLDLPEDVELGPLLDALLLFYAGFAVTSPFKRAAARHVGSSLEAVNTLVRRPDGWEAHNTDVDGARATLQALGAAEVTLLGSGGAAVALGLAAKALGVKLHSLRRGEVGEQSLQGTAIWTWPAHLPPPAGLRFAGGRVAVIAYGEPGHVVARHILERGGFPVRLGPRWLIAQARRQRELWAAAGA